MKTEKITFSVFHLFVKERFANIDNFTNIPKEDNYEKDNIIYKITTETIDNSYVWIYMEYGKAKPCPDELIDTETNKIIPNKRKPNEVELREQLFFLYFDEYLYLSDIKKAGLLVRYLNEKVNLGFHHKRVFKTPEEFVKTIKNLNEIKLTSFQRDMFNKTIFDKMQDDLCYDYPDTFEIVLKYKNKKVNQNNLLNFFKRIGTGKMNIGNMTCKGLDIDDSETLFNLNTVTKKIIVEENTNENGLFIEEQVRIKLIKEIKDNVSKT